MNSFFSFKSIFHRIYTVFRSLKNVGTNGLLYRGNYFKFARKYKTSNNSLKRHNIFINYLF